MCKLPGCQEKTEKQIASLLLSKVFCTFSSLVVLYYSRTDICVSDMIHVFFQGKAPLVSL